MHFYDERENKQINNKKMKKNKKNKKTIYHGAKNQKKLISYFWKKCQTDGQIDRQTDRKRCYRTLSRTGVQNLQHILRSHKIGSTFYTEHTLHKLLFKSKGWVALEGKNSTVYEIDCSKCKAVYFSESKPSLQSRSDEHKRCIKNYNCEIMKL